MNFTEVTEHLAICDDKSRAQKLLEYLDATRHKEALLEARRLAGQTVGVSLQGGEKHPRMVMLQEMINKLTE